MTTAKQIIEQIVACQNVGPPYKGWDLDALRTTAVTLVTVNITDIHGELLSLCAEFINVLRPASASMASVWLEPGASAETFSPGTTISITKLNEVTARARQYLELPSIEELNPDIARSKARLQAEKKDPNSPLNNALGRLFDNGYLKNTRHLWFPISEFKPNGLPVMIASPTLMDPLTNPEGVAVGHYNQHLGSFSVGHLPRELRKYESIDIHFKDVTHFILVKGPY